MVLSLIQDWSYIMGLGLIELIKRKKGHPDSEQIVKFVEVKKVDHEWPLYSTV